MSIFNIAKMMNSFLLPLPLTSIKKVRLGPATDNVVQENSVGVVMVSEGGYKAAYTSGGIDSPLSGSTNGDDFCLTCHETAEHCIGHGMVIHTPQHFNYNFMELIENYYNIFCGHCGHFLLQNLPPQTNKENLLKRSIELAKLVMKKVYHPENATLRCMHCSWEQSHIQRSKNQLTFIYKRNNEVIEEIKVSTIKHHLRRINSDDFYLLMGCEHHLLMELLNDTMFVLPYPQRITSESVMGLTTINNITVELRAISGFREPDDEDNLTFMSRLANFMVPGLNVQKNDETQIRIQRHQNTILAETPGGRNGTIRMGLTKVVSNVLRAVTVSDSNIRIGEIGIHKNTLVDLSISEIVEPFNLAQLEKERKTGQLQVVFYHSRGQEIHDPQAIQLQPLHLGDQVSRNLREGDYLYLTRNPSIYLTSMNAVRLVFYPHKDVFALSPQEFSVLKAGDFDGDVGTIEVPKNTYENFIAGELASTQKFIRSPNNGDVQLRLLDVHIFGLFVLTRFFENQPLHQLEIITLLNGLPKLMQQAFKLLKEQSLITGRQFFKLMIGENVNFQCETGWYMEEFAEQLDYWPGDDYLIISNGLMKQGVLDRKILGSGHNGSFFDYMLRRLAPSDYLQLIFVMEQVAVNVLSLRPLSISLQHYTLTLETMEKFEREKEVIEEEVQRIEERIENRELTRYNGEQIIRGLTMSLISRLDILLSDSTMEISSNDLLAYALIMGKASLLMEIFAPVGQILQDGKRPPLDEHGRASIFFANGDFSPQAHGWIKNSRRQGTDIKDLAHEAKMTREGIYLRTNGTSKIGAISRLAMVYSSGIWFSNIGMFYRGSFDTRVHPIAPRFGHANLWPHRGVPLRVDFLTPNEKHYQELLAQWPAEYAPLLSFVTAVRHNYLQSCAEMSLLRPSLEIDQKIRVPLDFGLLIDDIFAKKALPIKTDLTKANIKVLMEQLPELAWFNCLPEGLEAYSDTLLKKQTVLNVDENQLDIIGLWISSIIFAITADHLCRLPPEEMALILTKARGIHLIEQITPGSCPGLITMFCCMDQITQHYLDAPKKASGAASIKETSVRFNNSLRRQYVDTEAVMTRGFFADEINTKEDAEEIMRQLREVRLFHLVSDYAIYFIEHLEEKQRALIYNLQAVCEKSLYDLIIEMHLDLLQLSLINPRIVIRRLHANFPYMFFVIGPGLKAGKVSLFIFLQQHQENLTWLNDITKVAPKN